MQSRRTMLCAALLAVAVCLAALVGALGAGATVRPSHHRPPPTCPELVLSTAPQQVWIDRHGSDPSFPTRLICSASDHATVNVTMYYIFGDQGPGLAFVRALELMHRYHHVKVNVHIDSGKNGYFDKLRYAALVRITPGVHWYGCRRGCTSGRADAISHTKFITVSRLRATHRPAVLTTSANIGREQLVDQVQTGILFTDNLGLVQRFDHTFHGYRACSLRRCAQAATASTWSQYAGTAVYFAPNSDDPITDDLRALDCSQGGSIDIASLWLRRQPMIWALHALERAGCQVKVIVEQPDTDPPNAATLNTRTQFMHDKFIIIDTPFAHRLYEGSEDFSSKALHVNDNVVVRTKYRPTVDAYLAQFHWQWAHAVAPTTPAAAAIQRRSTASPDR